MLIIFEFLLLLYVIACSQLLLAFISSVTCFVHLYQITVTLICYTAVKLLRSHFQHYLLPAMCV